MAYSFQVAKEVLNDNDKNRLMCLYLNCEPSAINWEKATRDFGAASVESMRVMTRTALKKIEKAGGKEGIAATPAKAGGNGKKRKGAAEDGDDAEPTPTKKKPGRKAKKEVSPIEDGDGASEDANVKHEDGLFE